MQWMKEIFNQFEFEKMEYYFRSLVFNP